MSGTRKTPSSMTASRSSPKVPRMECQNYPVSEPDRIKMIAELAYFKAEKRGFVEGGQEQDWIEAEKEINSKLLSIK